MNNVMRVGIECHDGNRMVGCRCPLSERGNTWHVDASGIGLNQHLWISFHVVRNR